MATLAAMLRHKGLDVRGSDQDVYPPMSEFLAAEGIPALTRLPARAHHRRHRHRHRRQRDFEGQPRARGGTGSEDPVLLAAGSHSRALPLERAFDRHRRHAREDDHHVAGGLGADRRRTGPVGADRRNRPELRRSWFQLPDREGPRFRDRRRRVRQRVLRQDGQVSEVSAGHRGHQQRGIRSRGHLRRHECRDAGVPPPRQSRAAEAACCFSAPTARRRWP